MPCRSDHMEPQAREIEGREVCQHLLYVGKMMGVKWEPWVEEGANYIYGPRDDTSQINGGGKLVDRAVELLCSALRVIEHMPKESVDRVIYSASFEARKLADWWDAHKVADKKAGRS